jgi:hypothetical protein
LVTRSSTYPLSLLAEEISGVLTVVLVYGPLEKPRAFRLTEIHRYTVAPNTSEEEPQFDIRKNYKSKQTDEPVVD